MRTFLQEVAALAEPAGGWLAVVEVCGFNDWLLKLLAEYGCREIVLIQPEKRSKRKTDRRDANFRNYYGSIGSGCWQGKGCMACDG